MRRPAAFAAFRTGGDAPGGVLRLDVLLECRPAGRHHPAEAFGTRQGPSNGALLHECAFVVRPCRMTPPARPDHHQRHKTEH